MSRLVQRGLFPGRLAWWFRVQYSASVGWQRTTEADVARPGTHRRLASLCIRDTTTPPSALLVLPRPHQPYYYHAPGRMLSSFQTRFAVP